MKENKKNKRVDSILVIGGGISGMSASLDLADMGYRVYLVEKEPSIGGKMAQLDKTFPTLDCSICILAPKMVEVARHQNIELLTYSEVMDVAGDAGDFRVKIRKKPTYVNENCTGCGVCAEVCVLKGKIPNDFNQGLSKRGAAYITFPQAVPHTATIDAENCLYLKAGNCSQKCVDACSANAIDFEQKEEILEIDVGSIIVATGFDIMDPSGITRLGYGKYKDVITSMEYERLINASGPTGGKLERPSDGKKPKKIAFIQCVGSRSSKHKSYCSKICCMYATKEVVITREHHPDIDVEIFYNDRRPMAKGHEEFFKRSEREFKIKYINSLPSEIRETKRIRDSDPGQNDSDPGVLGIVYEDTARNQIRESNPDMVVLCPAIIASRGTDKLAGVIGIELDNHGFFKKYGHSNLDSSRKGIYLCGCSHGPTDIAISAAEASGAAIKAAIDTEFKAEVVKKEVAEKYIALRDKPRIGVFVCHCGINIGGVVDVKSVVEYAKGLSGVVYAGDNLYTCSEDAIRIIKDMIVKHDLNKVVVAACTPRTHEALFQETIREAGLNPYLFEMVNIRDQCSWPHMHEPKKATEKVKDLVAMSVAKARLLKPQKKTEATVKKTALVIGAGVSGMTAALALAKTNEIKVYLVERENETGGIINDMEYIEYGGEKACGVVKELTSMIKENKNVELMLNTKVKRVDGSIGNFEVSTISTKTGKQQEESSKPQEESSKPQQESKLNAGAIIVATGAGELKPCGFLYGENKNVCTQMEFEKIAGKKNLGDETIVMIQCVGAREDANRDKTNYDEKLCDCVDYTEKNCDGVDYTEKSCDCNVSYCGVVCCDTAIKNALIVKEKNKNATVYILYRDIVADEDYYRQARHAGIVFIKYDKMPVLSECSKNNKKNKKNILVKLVARDIDRNLEIEADRVVLSTPPVPVDNKKLSEILKVPLGQDGFFFEAHPKLRPLDFATNGIFVCGTAQGPKNLAESLNQAYGAASRAYTILSKDTIESEAIVSVVDKNKCIGCGNCEAVCPYGAIAIDIGKKELVAKTNPLLCKGCGTCAVECPANAITMEHFTDDQIMAMIDEVIMNLPIVPRDQKSKESGDESRSVDGPESADELESVDGPESADELESVDGPESADGPESVDEPESTDEPRILAFLCNWCSYAGADNAGVSRFQYPPNVRVIRVMCSGRVEPNYIYYALSKGVDGVLVAGCHKGDCHYISGNLNAEKRMENVNRMLGETGFDTKRVRLEWISASEGQRFADILREFTEELQKMGPSPLKSLS